MHTYRLVQFNGGVASANTIAADVAGSAVGTSAYQATFTNWVVSCGWLTTCYQVCLWNETRLLHKRACHTIMISSKLLSDREGAREEIQQVKLVSHTHSHIAHIMQFDSWFSTPIHTGWPQQWEAGLLHLRSDDFGSHGRGGHSSPVVIGIVCIVSTIELEGSAVGCSNKTAATASASASALVPLGLGSTETSSDGALSVAGAALERSVAGVAGAVPESAAGDSEAWAVSVLAGAAVG